MHSFGKGDKEIQPSDIKEEMVVVVEITIPEGVDTENLKVLLVSGEDDMSYVANFTINGNKLTFETSKLGEALK